jgi:hypothetical protein
MKRSVLRNFLFILLGFIIISLTTSFVLIESKPDASTTGTPEKKPEFFHNKNITDGPYIFYENDKIIVRWIKHNRPIERTISGKNSRLFKRHFGFEIDPACFNKKNTDSIDYKQVYSEVENIAAISDIHGQFDLTVQLLKNHGIIDAQYNWIFGKGHLVFNGDIMDRGEKVTELLWLTYRLEKQAEKAGGKVHFIIGNHEIMVLNNDIRYIHDKYNSSAKKMKKVYSQLFDENTFFGQWIKTKPAIVKINDILFVHAGISAKFLWNGLTAEQTNQIFHQKITGKSWDAILNDPLSTFLMHKEGPLWHRGYFDGQVKEYQVNHILNYFQVKHLVVGHTSMPNIISLMGSRIIGIDSNIKDGDYGEILIYKNGEFLRGTLNGNLMKLEQEPNK